MDSILKTVEALQRTPIPNLLIIFGALFLFLAFVGKIGAIIEIPPTRQKWSALLGAVFLITGLATSFLSTSEPPKVRSDGTTITSPPIKKSIPIASGDEVTLGSLVYKLLSVEPSNTIPDKISLSITIRLTTKDRGAILSQDSFRLLVEDVPRAPERRPKLNEFVPKNSARDGVIQFVIPNTVTDVKLQIFGQGLNKAETAIIPIKLEMAKP
jgi:hypothetical protein